MECDRAKKLWLGKEVVGFTKSSTGMILIGCAIRYASLFVTLMSPKAARLEGETDDYVISGIGVIVAYPLLLSWPSSVLLLFDT